MIETPRLMSNGVTVVFCEFTSDETYSMAKFVMDCLCLPWIDNYTEFHITLYDIFKRCSEGKDMTREHALRLADKYERFFKFGLPLFPKIRDGGRIMAPKEKHRQDAIDWLVGEKARIWHEVWELHTIKDKNGDEIEGAIRKIGGQWVFPGAAPDETYLTQQTTREERFWTEVGVRHLEYECTRREAIIAVSDYMPRAESEFQLPDPTLDDSSNQ